MNMPNFNDFLATLTPDVIAQIVDDANEKVRKLERKPDEPFGTMLGNQIGMINITISLELLGAYHKWLEQELGD